MAQSASSSKGKFTTFSDEQRVTLMKYFVEYGMTSTHRRNTDVIARCAAEVGTTVPKVKNWIGSEVVKRKRKAGILPLPKFEFSSGNPELKASVTPPVKKIRRVSGYNVFFSDYVQNHPELGPDFKERNAIVAQQWAELNDEERKEWGARAELVCSTSIQEYNQQQVSLQESSLLTLASNPASVTADENIVEKTLLGIQEKFELLEQLGFEGFAILVNTGALQTHLLATSKGKAYHKQRQQIGKPLENPFIGYVFSENNDIIPPVVPTPSPSATSANITLQNSPIKGLRSSNLSTETMQRSVINAFALKYKVATGQSEIPYNNLETLGVQVYGMPPGIPFNSPLLYNQHQLQQILANLEKIVFLKLSSTSQPDTGLPEVEIAPESVASLVDHGLHLQTDNES